MSEGRKVMTGKRHHDRIIVNIRLTGAVAGVRRRVREIFSSYVSANFVPGVSGFDGEVIIVGTQNLSSSRKSATVCHRSRQSGRTVVLTRLRYAVSTPAPQCQRTNDV